MRSEPVVRQISDELEKLTGFIADLGTENEFRSKDVRFACNVSDTLAWVLWEIRTGQFKSDDFLNLNHLKQIAKAIETRTGIKFADYKQLPRPPLVESDSDKSAVG